MRGCLGGGGWLPIIGLLAIRALLGKMRLTAWTNKFIVRQGMFDTKGRPTGYVGEPVSPNGFDKLMLRGVSVIANVIAAVIIVTVVIMVLSRM